MSQLARIYRNLIRAEEYGIEHREWRDSLFHPLSASDEELEKAMRANRRPMAAPETAYVKEKESFVR